MRMERRREEEEEGNVKRREGLANTETGGMLWSINQEEPSTYETTKIAYQSSADCPEFWVNLFIASCLFSRAERCAQAAGHLLQY